MKGLECKDVYLRPTGNNARGGRNPKVIKGVINKVARIYVTMTKEGHLNPSKYRFKGMHLDDGYNGGYQVYATKSDLEDQFFVEKVAKQITDEFPYRRNYEKLDRDVIEKIAALLKLKI